MPVPHLGHSVLPMRIATGPPRVRPCRTPPVISASSCSNFIRAPRPYPALRRATAAATPAGLTSIPPGRPPPPPTSARPAPPPPATPPAAPPQTRPGARGRAPRPPGRPHPPPRVPAPPRRPPPRQQPLAGPLRGAGKPVLLRIAARHRDQAQGQVGPVFAAQQPVPGDDR